MARAMVALGMKPSYEVIYQNAVNIDDLCLKYFEYWLDRDHMGWRDEMSEPDKQLQAQAQKTGRAMYPLQILKLIRDKGWHDQIADGLASVLTNDRSYFEKLVSSLYPLLEKLTTGPVSKLLSPDYSIPQIRALYSTGRRSSTQAESSMWDWTRSAISKSPAQSEIQCLPTLPLLPGVYTNSAPVMDRQFPVKSETCVSMRTSSMSLSGTSSFRW